MVVLARSRPQTHSVERKKRGIELSLDATPVGKEKSYFDRLGYINIGI